MISVGATSPPATPAEGERHIIGIGATGAWAGWDDSIALFSSGAWLRLIPQPGWKAWDVSAGKLLVFSGSACGAYIPNLQNLAGIGIGTTSDATNKLAISAIASDMTEVDRWLNDLELTREETLAVINDVMQRKQGWRPNTLKFFTGAMQNYAGQKLKSVLTPTQRGNRNDNRHTSEEQRLDQIESAARGSFC